MAQIASNQVVGMGCLRAFQEHVVFRIGADLKVRLGRNDDGRALNPFDDLLLRTLRQAKFGPGENFGVFPQNWRRNIEPELCVQREPKNVRLQSAPR